MRKKKRVLIAEDDPNILDLVELHLQDLDCKVDRAEDGETALQLALSNAYDLIILDIMLPYMDGFDVCKKIRQKEVKTPILMLTAKSEEFDKVLGLELGADDYLTKPFSIRELVARIKAMFRRSEMASMNENDDRAETELQFGDLVINLGKRKVFLRGEQIELTAKEFDLLALFAQKPGRTFTRSDLLDTIWGYQFAGYEHTVNSHINRLRAKIEADPAQPCYIQTVWGVGYRFVEPEELGV